jgi:hypothetical protein
MITKKKTNITTVCLNKFRVVEQGGKFAIQEKKRIVTATLQTKTFIGFLVESILDHDWEDVWEFVRSFKEDGAVGYYSFASSGWPYDGKWTRLYSSKDEACKDIQKWAVKEESPRLSKDAWTHVAC